MRALPLVALVLVATPLAACATRRLVYVVDAPPDAGARADRPPRVVGAAMTSDRGLVTVALRWPSSDLAPVDVEVDEAWLAPAGGAPCEGRLAGTMAVDGVTSWARPLVVVAGQTLEIAFPVADARGELGAVLPAPATVDLRVGARGAPARCERVPLPPPSAWRKAGRWSWGARVLLEPPGLPAASVEARVGRWLGPLRVGAELGVSMRQCGACLSALYLGLPVALTAEMAAAMRPGAALGLELAYTARPVRGTDDGDHYLLYGPRVTLRLGAAAPRDDGLPGGPMVGLNTFDIWWARVSAAGVAHWSQSLLGIGWSWDVGL